MKREGANAIRWITRTALLFALVLVVQMLGMPQILTGTLVNALLLLATSLVGITSGVVIGFFTPWVALSRGILPPLLAPMIPFIMGGNALLVVIFALWMRKKSLPYEVVGIVLGAGAKYLLLSQAVRFLVELPPPVARMMQIPQLFTALLGGVVALLLHHVVGKALQI